MGICAAKLDTTTPEGKLQYIFQHFDEDKDSYFSSAEYITFCGKMGNKMFDPDGWEEALAEYGQGWVCDGSGGIPFDGILMMYNQYVGDTIVPGTGRTPKGEFDKYVKLDFDYVLRMRGPPT